MATNPRIFDDNSAFEEAAAAVVAETLAGAVGERGRAAIALAGGGTPRGLYNRLGGESWRERIPWERVDLFWGDERCVPSDHPESNFRMVEETLLSKLALLPERIHRVPTELGAEKAAAAYAEELWEVLGEEARFDLVLLGLGDDGHTASLFPRTPRLRDEERWVVTTRSPQPPHRRVSLTLRVLNAARRVVFLVRGASKAAAVARVVGRAAADDEEGDVPPAALVRPAAGEPLWILDRSAAGLLPTADPSVPGEEREGGER